MLDHLELVDAGHGRGFELRTPRVERDEVDKEITRVVVGRTREPAVAIKRDNEVNSVVCMCVLFFLVFFLFRFPIDDRSYYFLIFSERCGVFSLESD